MRPISRDDQIIVSSPSKKKVINDESTSETKRTFINESLYKKDATITFEKQRDAIVNRFDQDREKTWPKVSVIPLTACESSETEPKIRSSRENEKKSDLAK